MHHVNLLARVLVYREPAYTISATNWIGRLWIRAFVAYARLDPKGAGRIFEKLRANAMR